MAEKAATGITEQLVSLGFESDRLKTGTPRSRWEKAWIIQNGEQPGDQEVVGFSFTRNT